MLVGNMTEVFTLYADYYCRANIRLSGEFPNPSRGRQRIRYCAEPWTSIPIHSDDCLDGTELDETYHGKPHVLYGRAFDDPKWRNMTTLAQIYHEFEERREITKATNVLCRLRYTEDAPFDTDVGLPLE